MKRIVLTGGGTAGHVTPNMALVPKLIDEGYNIYYIGSYEGMEKKLIEDIGVTYYGISSGKLRRYFDNKNFSDPFRVIKGFFEAKKILKKLRPSSHFPVNNSSRIGEPVSTAFPSGRSFTVSGKLQHTLLALGILNLFANPGVISDS